MATIVVVDLANVTVDGVPSGSVTDVLTNFKNVAGIRGDLLRALQDWSQGERKAAADARKQILDDKAAALADRDAKAAAAREQLIAAHAADRDAKVAALQARIDQLQAKDAEKQALIEALGGTEVGKQMAKAARRQEAQRRKQEAEQELLDLDADLDVPAKKKA